MSCKRGVRAERIHRRGRVEEKIRREQGGGEKEDELQKDSMIYTYNNMECVSDICLTNKSDASGGSNGSCRTPGEDFGLEERAVAILTTNFNVNI